MTQLRVALGTESPMIFAAVRRAMRNGMATFGASDVQIVTCSLPHIERDGIEAIIAEARRQADEIRTKNGVDIGLGQASGKAHITYANGARRAHFELFVVVGVAAHGPVTLSVPDAYPIEFGLELRDACLQVYEQMTQCPTDIALQKAALVASETWIRLFTSKGPPAFEFLN